VGCDLHDQITVESGTDPLQKRDGRHDPTGLQTGKSRLRHTSAGGEFNLRQAKSQATLAYGLSDQEGPAGFGVPLAVLNARPTWPREFLVGRVLYGRVVHLPIENLAAEIYV
jgi:hypothetical protein